MILAKEALVAYKKILIDDQNKLYAISRDLNVVLARTTKFESKISGLADIFFDLALYSTVAAKSKQIISSFNGATLRYRSERLLLG